MIAIKKKSKRGGQPGNKNSMGNKGGGTTSKYKPEYDDQVYGLCLLGLTEKEVAAYFGVSESTVRLWKKEHSSFSAAVQGGKENADVKVAAALYKRAIGYKYRETTFEAIVIDKKKNVQLPAYKKKVVIKELPADVGAATTWLKNRWPDRWRELKVEDLSDEQIDHLFNRHQKRLETQQ